MNSALLKYKKYDFIRLLPINNNIIICYRIPPTYIIKLILYCKKIQLIIRLSTKTKSMYIYTLIFMENSVQLCMQSF